jgi:cellulose synthase/poly-beta-1,6-N-acetylglucosamine synthase-like glycosyltransferase
MMQPPKLAAVELPDVTIILPVFDEAEAIDRCLESLAGQDYGGRMSIVVADGGSMDGTRERLKEWAQKRPSLIVIDNPERLQSHGLNRAALVTDSEILVRADAHTRYARDYVACSVKALLHSDAVAVGGPMVAEGAMGTPRRRSSGVRLEGASRRSRFRRAVGHAMRSRFGVGPGRFHRPDAAGPVDTVYLGTYRRSDLIEIRGYRVFPSEVAEDADLYYRWRREGRTVLLDPAIVSEYVPRDSPRSLSRQYYRYGRGKADLLWANGTWPSWRPLAPLLLVVGLIVGAVLTIFSPWPLIILVGLWLVVLLAAAVPAGRSAPLVPAAAAIMHISYGVGLLQDLLRGPGSVRKAGLGGITGSADGGDDSDADESNDLADQERDTDPDVGLGRADRDG